MGESVKCRNSCAGRSPNVPGVARRLGPCGGGCATRADRCAAEIDTVSPQNEKPPRSGAVSSSGKSSASALSISSTGDFRRPSRRRWSSSSVHSRESAKAPVRPHGCIGEPRATPWTRCYGAVPCWIMPTWRVAEQLPAEMGAVELVIIDEASQSDVTELPALLRGKKILVVGDDRQVSPTAPSSPREDRAAPPSLSRRHAVQESLGAG